MEAFLGSIMTFGFAYAPRGWALCNGQLLALNQNQALFSLIGVSYGGNGVNTFQLPNLQSRLPMCQGAGPNLTARTMGEIGGTETITLLATHLPAHDHVATVSNLVATTHISLTKPAVNNVAVPSATNGWVGGSGGGQGAAKIFSTAAGADPITQQGVSTSMSGNVEIGVTGASQPFSGLNPLLVVNFSVAMQGIFPSRN